MYDSLTACGWDERDVMIFPNGINEELLLYVLTNLRLAKVSYLFIYICTETPVADFEKTVWLGGNEIRKAFLERSVELPGDMGVRVSVQVIYDCDREFVSGEDWCYAEDIVAERFGVEEAG